MASSSRPADAGPQLTVVLSTYNRAAIIDRTLRHLAAQDLARGTFDVIVVDDGSSDDTRQVVAGMAPGLPFELSYLHHQNRGPGFTQNRGIRAARAPLLLLMADDIFLEPGAVRAHIDMHRRHCGRAVAVLGRVAQSPELTQSVFLRHWDPFQMQKLEQESELPYFMFWACNLSIPRAFLIENGLFREPKGRGGAPAHEDVELGYRLTRRGLRIFYSRDAAAAHYHVYTLDQAIRRYHERGLNWDEFRQLVPDPEFVIHTHYLTRDLLAQYVRVLRGPNTLIGPDRSLARHLLRHVLRAMTFNRVTVPLLWRPLLDLAERNPMAASVVSSRLYAAFLYYHFLRGIDEAKTLFAPSDPAHTPTT